MSASTDSLGWLAQLTSGQTRFDAYFSGVSIDTRTLQPGELFFALTGGNRDGHDFVPQAMAAGAAAVVVERALDPAIPSVQVSSSAKALEQLALEKRRRFKGVVLAITGSAGKTTTKEILGALVGVLGPTCVAEKSYNNKLGVCLTLCRLQSDQDYAVLELGANAPGEIAELAAMVKPHWAVLTNAGRAHLEGFGSVAGVVEAKGEILEALAADGVAVLPADQPAFEPWKERAAPRRCISYGHHAAAAYRLLNVQPNERAHQQGLQIELTSDRGLVRAWLPLVGEHNALNATCAAAVAMELGATSEQIIAGLASVSGPQRRLQQLSPQQGGKIYDDSYNANPESVTHAIDFLSQQSAPRILVLGDMGELGAESEQLHRQVGAYARDKGLEHLFAIGPLAYQAAEAFGLSDGGRIYSSQSTLRAVLDAELEQGATLLIKGSRTAGLDQLVDGLMSGSLRGPFQGVRS
ncbi:MAG: UDP-N-acetylmuramoyl-tripeptide--D-alanyl-D-alanine ligase [Gammaproteobacteria bacterium]